MGNRVLTGVRGQRDTGGRAPPALEGSGWPESQRPSEPGCGPYYKTRIPEALGPGVPILEAWSDLAGQKVGGLKNPAVRPTTI